MRKVRKHTNIWKFAMISTIASSWLLGDISGVVYKDFDLNGEMNGGDAGVSGVTVVATCSDGGRYETTTNKDGNYTLSGMPEGSECRVEADPSSVGLGSAPNAKGSAPLVDMVSDGSIHNISTGSPATYCQENPDVILASTPGWFTDDDDNRLSPEGFGSIFKVPTPEIGDFNNNKTISDKRKVLTNWEDTGAIWGAAWKKSTKELFVSAVIKRYVPLKDETTDPAKAAGAIYKVSPDGSVTLFTTIDDVITSDDETIIKSRSYGENEDTDIKELVGAKGLGDLDISEDDKYLYTINLKNKTLIKIDAITGEVLSAAAIPNPYGGQCSDEMVRPWALKVRGSEIFIGSVCENEILDGDDPTDMDAEGLGAAIQKYDGSDFSNVAQTNTLRFLRPKGYNPKKETNYQYQNTDWSHGSYEWLPQPMLTDIEFTNEGDLVLGYTDRSIMIRERSGSHGDIRKMCLNEDGTYTDESTAKAPTNCPSTKVEYEDNDEDYYEFYVGDYFNGYLGEDGHPETASGALAMAPGAPNIIVGMVDGTDWWQPGSIGLYSNENGDKIAAQAVINKDKTVDGGEREPYAAKAGGMGDVELLCDPAPIEIGNYVWMDLDKDGIQDPKEPPFKDVNVTLRCEDEEYGIATTDKNGHYYFGGIDNVNLYDGKTIVAELDCELSIKKSDVNNKDASEQDPNSDQNDTIDNDAAADGDYNKFTFTTTASNDHTRDFGILPSFGCVSGQLKQNEGADDPANDVTVTLKDAYGNVFVVETDSNGNYAFDHILAGDVTVEVDTSDTDLNERTVWETNTTADLEVKEGTYPDECAEQDFTYSIESDLLKIDPVSIATCAKPTSIVWEGSEVEGQDPVTWASLAEDLENIETVGGDPVKIKSMSLTYNDDNELNDDKSGTKSGGGYNGKPFLSFYLGDQASAGDGEHSNTYDLKAGEKIEITVEFEEPVVLDNWRVRDIDSGDKRDSDDDGTDEPNWDWQDAIQMVGYDAEGNIVPVEAKIASETTSIVDSEGFVRTDIGHTDNCALVPTYYNEDGHINYHSAGENPNCTGENDGTGYTADDPEGQVVFTSNFKPLTKIVITHKAGPDLPDQTRSALAMFGFAVCKPLHIAGTVYDDSNGTDQAACDNDDTIDGVPISTIEGKALNACLVDEDSVVMASQVLENGSYDFSADIHPNTTYGIVITTSECEIGNKVSEGELAEDWKFEGETYTTSPDGELDGYVDVELSDESEMNIDFAINKVPSAKGFVRAEELNPGGDIQVDFVNDGSVTSDFINDHEEGENVTIKVTRISSGKLYYDGTKVNPDDIIENPDFSLFKVDPEDGDVKATFSYEVIDSACRASDEALFEAPFNTIFISGNLFLDQTRNNTVDGDATPYSCDGTTQLYVNLVDENNKVVSAKAIDESGSYGFYYDDGLRSETTYNIVLSTTSGKEGEEAPDATLTASCAHADGEHIGTDEGTDGTADGIIRVEVEKENIDEINFAITPTVKIGDRLWSEDDNDGDATTGKVEPIVDHEVTISCENGYSASTKTDNNGLYWFELLSNSGTCTVKTETPTDMTPAKGSKENDSVDDTSSENDKTHNGVDGTSVNVGTADNLTLDFGFASVGDLCGQVTEDTNGDGRGDKAISNVTLLLYADDNADGRADGSILQTTTTDSEGNYCFNKIQAANYVVNEQQPNGFLDVSENEGGDDHDMGNNGVTNSIAAVVDAGEVDSGNDFVEEKPSSLGNRVWYDDNANGIQDENEPGVSSVNVSLLDENNHVISTVKTDDNGEYLFSELSSGEYQVVFDLGSLPGGYEVTGKNSGSSESDSDVDPKSGKTDSITLPSGTEDLTWDMGIHIVGATSNTPYLLGTHFWVDDNKNTLLDDGEKRIANALVELCDEEGNKLYWIDEAHSGLTTEVTPYPAQMYTDENGEYRFYVPAGTYRVRFHIPETDEYRGYIFDDPKENADDDQNINTADKHGLSQSVTVGNGHENVVDLTLDAGINCGCDNAPVKSNGGNALGLFGMFGMIFMTLFSVLIMNRKEDHV